ncbi:hypothetical protein TNCV_4970611 [Trichonephila clavipes]|nr:hypothetical protein TNCV_4970611 [Trichonephila clavipes]
MPIARATDEQLKALLETINVLKSDQEETNQRVEYLEKKLPACGKTTNENKFVPASAVPVPASPVSVKLST